MFCLLRLLLAVSVLGGDGADEGFEVLLDSIHAGVGGFGDPREGVDRLAGVGEALGDFVEAQGDLAEENFVLCRCAAELGHFAAALVGVAGEKFDGLGKGLVAFGEGFEGAVYAFEAFFGRKRQGGFFLCFQIPIT